MLAKFPEMLKTLSLATLVGAMFFSSIKFFDPGFEEALPLYLLCQKRGCGYVCMYASKKVQIAKNCASSNYDWDPTNLIG